MSRVSDTRIRTREAAARLVAAGRRPHELTVDLIYAEIRQGSRTTINEELKLWKDEQAKADALNASLPPEVANAMLNVWAMAVEQGEKVFLKRQDEVESELTTALQQTQLLGVDLAREREEGAALRVQLAARQAEAEALQNEVVRERTATEAARRHAQATERQIESSRTEAENRLAALINEHKQQLAQIQAAMTKQEQTYRAEIAKATERLEGVQKHVMLQVAEARETTKRTEALLAKAQQKNEGLSAETQRLSVQLSIQTQVNETGKNELAKLLRTADQLRVERETLIQQIAMLTGKLDSQTKQIESLEHRANSAESRLEDVLKQSTAAVRKKPEKRIVGRI